MGAAEEKDRTKPSQVRSSGALQARSADAIRKLRWHKLFGHGFRVPKHLSEPRFWPSSGLPTIRDLGALHSVSASACACHQHPSYVLLSMHSVIEKLSGAS